MTLHSLTRFGFIIVAPYLFGCGDHTVDDTVTRTEPQLLQRGTAFPNSLVKVCWEIAGNGINVDASSTPNFANLAFWTRDEVENQWGRVSGLNFIGWGNCTTADAMELGGWVAIHFEIPTPDTPTACQMGYLAGNNWTRCRLDPTQDEVSFRRTVLHEFGHALGFDHEVNRDDRPDNYGCENSYDKIPGGTKLTDYDVASIMDYSYCAAAASGTLSPWDIVGVQKVYGRKHSGALVGIGGRCVNIPNADPTLGTQLQIYDCSNANNDRWSRSPAGNLNASLGTNVRSINAPNGNPASLLTIWSDVESSVNEHFDFKSVKIRGLGNLCVTASDNTTGSSLSMAACSSLSNLQTWDWEKIPRDPSSRNNRFRRSGTNMCLNVPNGVAVEGAFLQLYPCGSPFYENELFQTTARGEIKTLAPAKCLTVNPNNTNIGNVVIFSNCAKTLNRNQQFSVASGQVRWTGDNGQCLDVANGVSVNGASVQLHPCVAGAPNEVWDYYF